MPEAGFTRNIKLPTSGGKYFRLKAKGEMIKFVIANTPHYKTKHWVSDKETVLCGKYNGQGDNAVCEWCDRHKDQLLEAGEDKDKIQVANKIRPATDFFYPVVNLDSNEAVIFQIAQSVHWAFVKYHEQGVDVFKTAWCVERTETPGNYYSLIRLDPVELTAKQQQEFERAKNFKLSSEGQASHSVVNDDLLSDLELKD